ncbi:MAG: hypothetical protein ABI411_08970 [Tahibacter sp.]
MLRSHVLLCLLLPLMLSLSAFRDAPLVDPAPIAIPTGVGDAQVAKAVRQALLARQWTVAAEQPGLIRGHLTLREHTANIDIAWIGGQSQIRYVSSNNLKFDNDNGQRSIHKNYLGWINNLVADINGNLTLLAT